MLQAMAASLGATGTEFHKGETLLKRLGPLFQAYGLCSSQKTGSPNTILSAVPPLFHVAGNGGFLGATGTEFHTGETLPEEIGSTFPSIRVVFFCPVAQDGSPYAFAVCPSNLGELDVGRLSREFNGLDVAEVKHPSEL